MTLSSATRLSSTHAFLLAFATLALVSDPTRAHAQSPREELWVTDGAVSTVATSGDIVYLGGSFSEVGPATGAGAVIDSASGIPLANYPKILGEVTAAAPDGAGGWYIGGLFTYVQGQPRNNLARLDANGDLMAWNPGTNGRVNALAVSGGVVYVGGLFGTAAGVSRSNVAAVNGTTGVATSWNPNASQAVYALAISGNTIYAGGAFLNIGGGGGPFIAALNNTNGASFPFGFGDTDAPVLCLATSGLSVYAGGNFNVIGGEFRSYIAELDPSGFATFWDPFADAPVRALAVGTGVVYAGGDFMMIGGAPQFFLAAINAADGTPVGWPGTTGPVRAIVADGGTIYVGGTFNNVGPTARKNLAALNFGGTATAWNPRANGPVSALAAGSGKVFAGGSFASVGGVARRNLAALSAITGQATSWNPGTNVGGTVQALAPSGSTIYVGGLFTSAGGQSRNSIAAIDASTGLATSWNPNVTGTVRALAVSGGTVYAGGDFTQVGANNRSNIAALSASTGSATAWDPGASSTVRALAVDGTTIYVGGAFSTIATQTRSGIAALDVGSALATAWNPNATGGDVVSIFPSGGFVYAAGGFTTIGGHSRSRVAALDAVTGGATSWDPVAIGGTVNSVVENGGRVYAGGTFTDIGGQPRNFIAELDPITGTATSWDPDPSSHVVAMAVSGGTLYAVGLFESIATEPRRGILGIESAAPPGWTLDGVPVTNAPGIQQNPVVARDGESGAIVAWEGYPGTGPTGDSRNLAPEGPGHARIFSERLDAAGDIESGWPSNGVTLSTTDSNQLDPAIASDDSSGAIVVWEDDRNGALDIYAQRVTGSGTIAPNWPAAGVGVCTASGNQQNPSVVQDAQGGAMIFWEDGRGANVDIYALRITRTGAIAVGWPANGLAVCTATGDQLQPVVTPGASGSAIVAWMDARNGAFDVYAQRVTGAAAVAAGWPANGLPLCSATGNQVDPAIASDQQGGAIVVWGDARGDSSDVYAQRVTEGGAIAAGWTANGVALAAQSGKQRRPTVVTDEAGGVIAAWEDGRPNGGNGFDAYAQRITGAGAVPAGWATHGNALCTAAGDQQSVRLVLDGRGGAIATWEDGRGANLDLYANQITATGTIDSRWAANGSPLCGAGGDQMAPAIVTDDQGGATVAWTDGRVLQSDIYAMHIVGPSSPSVTWVGDGLAAPKSLGLSAWPNPARVAITFGFELPAAGLVRLEVVDVTGRRVRRIESSAPFPAGRSSLRWDARDDSGIRAPAGIYFVRLIVEERVAKRRFALIP